MKIYELAGNKALSPTELLAEAHVSAVVGADLREVMNLVTSGKYPSFDEIIVKPETPPELLAKFEGEHLHNDDEVRYFISGQAIFDVRGKSDQWIRIEVSEGDFITVPAGLYHRFYVPGKKVKALRLFSGSAGWVPEYRVI